MSASARTSESFTIRIHFSQVYIGQLGVLLTRYVWETSLTILTLRTSSRRKQRIMQVTSFAQTKHRPHRSKTRAAVCNAQSRSTLPRRSTWPALDAPKALQTATTALSLSLVLHLLPSLRLSPTAYSSFLQFHSLAMVATSLLHALCAISALLTLPAQAGRADLQRMQHHKRVRLCRGVKPIDAFGHQKYNLLI